MSRRSFFGKAILGPVQAFVPSLQVPRNTDYEVVASQPSQRAVEENISGCSAIRSSNEFDSMIFGASTIGTDQALIAQRSLD
jgi:hypothetical protein